MTSTLLFVHRHYRERGDTSWWGLVPHRAYVFANRMVITFDTCGHQVPAFQGELTAELERRLAERGIVAEPAEWAR